MPRAELEILVMGTPVPQPKAFTFRTRKGVAVTKSAPSEHPIWAYRVEIERQARQAAKAAHRKGPFQSPVISIFFAWPFLGKPRTRKPNPPRPHLARPDLDNLMKGVLDALVRAGVILDDSRIWAAHVTKVRLAPGCLSYTRIFIRDGQDGDLIDPHDIPF